MRVVYWGTYDKGKPRNRIMLQGLRENGVEVLECHRDVWQRIEDKSRISGLLAQIKLIVIWLSSYPRLIFQYLRLPRHDCVVVGYMGHLDILVLWLFAKIKGVPIIWDAFLSLYNTVVEDRQLVGRYHPLALLIYCWEWLACRCARQVILDTNAHGRYFVSTFNLPLEKVKRVFVGAEAIFFDSQNKFGNFTADQNETFTVLFYGQYIPLHGIEYIVRAAKLTEHENIRWVLIGQGQEKRKIEELIKELGLHNIESIDWVPYEELITWIRRVDVGLGIFGDTDKAKRVIPNKVFQLLAAGCPLITGDTEAIRELLIPSSTVRLVSVAEPKELADMVIKMSLTCNLLKRERHDPQLINNIRPGQVGKSFKPILLTIINN